MVTNVGLAHAEHLGGPDGVVAVKGELLEALPRTGVAIVDGDDGVTPPSGRAQALPRCSGPRYGPGVDVRLTPLHARRRPPRVDRRQDTVGIGLARPRCQGEGERPAPICDRGRQLAQVAPDLIAAGLAAATGSRWRLELERRADGVAVLNDVYNANPTSMAAALRALVALPSTGRRIAVLGEMRELGIHAADAHREVGELVARLPIDVVVGVGEWGAAITAAAGTVPTRVDVADAADALSAALTIVQPGDTVLIKASRAVGLELVATGLLGRGRENCGSHA